MASEGSAMTDRGFYYSPDRSEIVEAGRGSALPEADDWEYIGGADDMTPADAVAAVQERYPDTSIELEFRHL